MKKILFYIWWCYTLGESHHEALRRELSEECGATLMQVTGELGKVISYAHALEEDLDTFKMTSYYYFCEINGNLGALNLNDYEKELGFRPEWVEVGTALETNKMILAESNPAPWWTRREVFVLGHIISSQFFSKTNLKEICL